MSDMTMDDDFGDAMALGTGYALYRHGQDRLAAQIRAALDDVMSDFRVADTPITTPEERVEARPRLVDLSFPPAEEDLIGHHATRQQLQLHIESARIRRGRLPHLLLTSTMSGVGRRALIRWAAGELGKNLVELVPPFSPTALYRAVGLLGNYDILYVDDLHRACQQESPGPQALLDLFDHELTDAEGESRWVPEITIVGATTDPSAVAESLLDRFVVRMDLPDPTWGEVSQRVVKAAARYRALDLIDDEGAVTIAELCLVNPSAIDGMVILARDLALTLGRPPLPEELTSWWPPGAEPGPSGADW